MSLAWNTRELLHGARSFGTSIEYHFLSNRQLFDSTILTADINHSSAGHFAIRGDNRWYTVSVVTRPVYALPQELCLSFVCADRTVTLGTATSSGPPADDIALEYGALLSLLAREPLVPLGIRRERGVALRLESGAGRIHRADSSRNKPPAGIDSKALNAMLLGLANAEEADAKAVMAAVKLYHVGLSLASVDISSAYFSLVSAIECLSGQYYHKKEFGFDDAGKFQALGQALTKLEPFNVPAEIIDGIKEAAVKGEHFISKKFRDFIVQFLPATFWREDDLYPSTGLPKILPDRLLDFLKEAYAARSNFTHEGTPFPAHVQVGFGDWVRVSAVMQALRLAEAKKFVPPFIWFERLTHCVIVEFLHMVIAPDLDKERQKREAMKCSIMADIAQLSDEAKTSLKRLADWTLKFDGLALIGPQANDTEWATDALAASELRDSGLVGRDTARGTSWIKDRLVGEVIGEHFYGSEHNPFRDCTVLPPEGLE
jgi:hypothetical protein